jgi:CPA1 family monovalent cation:H+ antiporter
MTGTSTVSAMEVFVLLVAAASLLAIFTRRSRYLPYPVALVLLGLVVAFARPRIELRIDPELILAVLLPALVFEASYRIDLRTLLPNLAAVLLLAVPGVLVSAGIVAVILHLVTGLPLGLCFLVGTMLAATDPAAILSVIGQAGAPRALTNLIEAESLLNDGTGIVIFVLAVQALSGGIAAADVATGLLLSVSLSTLIGAAIGFLASRLLVGIADHLIELTVSLVAAYGSYLLAAHLGQSGLIATVVCGLVLGSYGRRVGISRGAQQAIDTVWEFLAFLATTLVFLLVGLASNAGLLLTTAGYTLAALLGLLVARGLVVYGLLGAGSALLNRLIDSRPIAVPWLHVVAWAGLRGAVSVALALSLPAELPERELLQGIVFGCVVVTLIVQGTTARPLVRRLDLAGDRREA